MTRNEALKYRQSVADGEAVAALGGIKTHTEQSDKLGFDWICTQVNDVTVKREYTPQDNPVGTSVDNPIIYADGVPLIDNAFYSVDGIIKVWMGQWVEWISAN